jgi:hypothetical protein
MLRQSLRINIWLIIKKINNFKPKIYLKNKLIINLKNRKQKKKFWNLIIKL